MSAASGVAGAIVGGFATTLASGPRKGLAGVAIWGGLGYGGEALVATVNEWRADRAAAVHAERALMARLTRVEQEEWALLFAKNKGARIQAIGAPGSAAKAPGVVPDAPRLEVFVAAAEARRGITTVTMNREVASASAPSSRIAGDGSSSHGRDAARSTDSPGSGQDESAQAFPAYRPPSMPVSSWVPAWMPLKFGVAAEADRVERLTAKLREIDETLGVDARTTQADLDAALRGKRRLA